MNEQPATRENKVGKCQLQTWVEERAVAAVDNKEIKTQNWRHGHRGILTMDQESKMEAVSTLKEAYGPPKIPGVRLHGLRVELLKKHITQMISEQLHAELNPPTPKTDFCSTTQKDFCVEGFVPLTPKTTQERHSYNSQLLMTTTLHLDASASIPEVHDYKTDQAITFWSENYQRIQGATAIQTLKAPFRKSARYSTPICERLDEIELPPDN
uniref:sperm-associated antigen 8 isoform X2 n=1 Tax=Monopterus albus TaxID=43700 RepID=UPI0009B35B08|nr:sperm-associated antigen 8 isoform X2 [Monopterus albus]